MLTFVTILCPLCRDHFKFGNCFCVNKIKQGSCLCLFRSRYRCGRSITPLMQIARAPSTWRCAGMHGSARALAVLVRGLRCQGKRIHSETTPLKSADETVLLISSCVVFIRRCDTKTQPPKPPKGGLNDDRVGG